MLISKLIYKRIQNCRKETDIYLQRNKQADKFLILILVSIIATDIAADSMMMECHLLEFIQCEYT